MKTETYEKAQELKNRIEEHEENIRRINTIETVFSITFNYQDDSEALVKFLESRRKNLEAQFSKL